MGTSSNTRQFLPLNSSKRGREWRQHLQAATHCLARNKSRREAMLDRGRMLETMAMMNPAAGTSACARWEGVIVLSRLTWLPYCSSALPGCGTALVWQPRLVAVSYMRDVLMYQYGIRSVSVSLSKRLNKKETRVCLRFPDERWTPIGQRKSEKYWPSLRKVLSTLYLLVWSFMWQLLLNVSNMTGERI